MEMQGLSWSWLSMFWLRIVSPLVLCGLSACGTHVPEAQDFNGSGNDSDTAGMLLTHAIVESIHCEVRKAIRTVIDNDNEAARLNRGIRHASYLDNWAAQISITLQTEEKSTVSPTFSWLPLSLFTLGASVGATADATRIDKFNYFYSVRDLYQFGKCSDNFDPYPSGTSRPVGSLFIRSDLKLAEWLSSQVLEVGTQALNAPDTVKTPLQQNVLSHEVKFDIVSTAGLTPGWNLVQYKINQAATLLAGTRDRLHDLVIVLGPVDPSQPGTLAPTAQASYLASQIGVAIEGATRSGLLP